MDLPVVHHKKAPEQKPHQASAQELEQERQRKKLEKMEKVLEEMREKMETYKQKADEKQASIKQLINQNKRKEAQGQLQVLKTIKAEIEKQENLCVILEKTKLQLEVAVNTYPVVDIMKEAASLQKEYEEKKEFFEDFISERREMDEQNKEISSILKESANVSEQGNEEIDELYKVFEQAVIDDQIDSINKDPLKNVIKPRDTQPVQVNIDAQAKQAEDKELDDLLEKAAMYN